MRSLLSRRKLKMPETQKSPIRRYIGRFFMGLGVMAFLSITLSLISFFSLLGGAEKIKPLPKTFVVVHEFSGAMADVNNVHPLMAEFSPPSMSLYGFLQSLNAAKNDDRVEGLVVKIKDGDYSLTQIETLRNAIIDFRASGKKAYAYSDNFGGFSNGMGEYWLATAFDKIWLNPMGIVSINGIYAEQPFFKDALDKIGVDMQMEHRKNYKTGAEMYTRNSMSSYNRETIEVIVNAIMDRLKGDIVDARRLDKTVVMDLIDKSPLTADEAKNAYLVNRVAYIDELEDLLKGDADRDDLFVSLSRYKYDVMNTIDFGVEPNKVALVLVNGAIVETDEMQGKISPMTFIDPSNIANAEMIASSLNEIKDNDDIEVVIIRVNSPGGSPSASEKIRRAIVKVKEAGKYVIVSMADVAASGGYWVSVDADMIVAQDLTITGSIGVYGGKPDLSGLWDTLGVNWQAIEYGENASMWTVNKGMSKGELRRLSVMMDRIYDAFTKRVANGRSMEATAVEKVAQGRAWIGRDAQRNGLVDDLVGFDGVLSLAAEKAGATTSSGWSQMGFDIYPKPKDPFADLSQLLGIPSVKNSIELPDFMVPALYDNAIVLNPSLSIEF